MKESEAESRGTVPVPATLTGLWVDHHTTDHNEKRRTKAHLPLNWGLGKEKPSCSQTRVARCPADLRDGQGKGGGSFAAWRHADLRCRLCCWGYWAGSEWRGRGGCSLSNKGLGRNPHSGCCSRLAPFPIQRNIFLSSLLGTLVPRGARTVPAILRKVQWPRVMLRQMIWINCSEKQNGRGRARAHTLRAGERFRSGIGSLDRGAWHI